MGVFSRNTINESYDSPSSIMNESIETPSIYDGKYDYTMESAYRIAAENECNYTAIMRAVGINELATFENGEEFYINEAGGFFSTVVNFLKNIWEKIKGIFRKFIATFDAMTKSDADFIKKYKPYITKSDVLKNFKYQGFKFTIPDTINIGDVVQNGFDGIRIITGTGENEFKDVADYDELLRLSNSVDVAELNKIKSTVNDEWDEAVEGIRSEVTKGLFDNKIKVSNTLDAAELNTALFEFFRNDESNKITLEENDIDINEIISDLTNSAKVKTNVNKAFKKNQDWFNKQITKLNKISDKAIKDMPGENLDKIPNTFKNTREKNKITVTKQEKYKAALDYINFWAQTTSRLYKEITSIMTICQNAWLKAINDRSKQEKAICVALVNRGTNVQHYGESYSFESEGSSYLGNVKLI